MRALTRIWAVVLVLNVGDSTSGVARSDEISPLGFNRGLDLKILNAWKGIRLEDRQSLGQSVREASQAVALVGTPSSGQGTAWVISRKHRLLVTNAHVADIMHPGGTMEAILSGTSHRYSVAQAWYHPGVRRYLLGEKLSSIRSMNPKDGPIDPLSPDLAVLQLADGGPDLPSELIPATPQELTALLAQPAAIYGFPGHDTFDWPEPNAKVAATFHDGSISRLTDFRLSPDGPDTEMQFVQYSMSTWPGFSGSPVLLTNGHVAAVHNMSRPVTGRAGSQLSIPHGIRIDCVWELLVHHGLDQLVTVPVRREQLNVGRWLVRDERDEALREAMRLIDSAQMTAVMQPYPGAGASDADQAIRLAPHFAAAYGARAFCIQQHFTQHRDSLPRDEALALLERIRVDQLRQLELAGATSPGIILNFASWARDFSSYTGNHDMLEKTVEILGALAANEDLRRETRSSAMCLQGEILELLGEQEQALAAYTRAIVANPDSPQNWETRAKYLRKTGRAEAAANDEAMSQRVLRAFVRLRIDPPRSADREILAAEGQVTSTDGKDDRGVPAIVRTIPMEADKTYFIELRSADFDAYLRLEDPEGNTAAEDDDGLGGPHSRIIVKADRTGDYRIIISSTGAKQTGTYQFRVIRSAMWRW